MSNINRFIAVISLVVSLLSLCVAIWALSAKTPNELTVTRLVLIDANGQTRMILKTNPDGNPLMQFKDKDNKTRAYFDVYGDEVRWAFVNQSDARDIRLTVGTKKGQPAIVFWDKGSEEKKARVLLHVKENGAAGIQVNDQRGNMRIVTGTTAEGEAKTIWYGYDTDGNITPLQMLPR